MKRKAGCTLAAAVALAASLGAQTATSTGDQRMKDASTSDRTVVGCLTRGADGKYMLTNARMDMGGAADHARAATGTTGTLPTNTAEAVEANMGSAMTWLLQGSDLDKHVGHQVQVTGRSAASAGPSMTTTGATTGSSTSTTGATTTTGTTAGATTTTTSPTTTAGETTTAGAANVAAPRLDVTSVKTLAPHCS
jgi:hypothetical protein